MHGFTTSPTSSVAPSEHSDSPRSSPRGSPRLYPGAAHEESSSGVYGLPLSSLHREESYRAEAFSPRYREGSYRGADAYDELGSPRYLGKARAEEWLDLEVCSEAEAR